MTPALRPSPADRAGLFLRPYGLTESEPLTPTKTSAQSCTLLKKVSYARPHFRL